MSSYDEALVIFFAVPILVLFTYQPGLEWLERWE